MRQISKCIDVVAGGTGLEVDVVESIQELYAYFKVNVFSEFDLLGKAQIRPEERWSVKNQISETALANEAPARSCQTRQAR